MPISLGGANSARGNPKGILQGRYHLADEIGRGASGIVHKALNLQTGAFVAIKEVTLRGVSKDQLQLLQREIDLLKLLENPYIVEYRESFNTKDTLYIVMEFVENGSLSTMLKKYGRLPEALVGVYTVQVLGGLHYLHEQGVIHRDIKGANILISTEGRVKLADFGVATKMDAAGFDTQANTVMGTPYWMSPEIIQMSGFTTASDIWSVGCTVIELVSGSPPYFSLPPMSALFRIVHDQHPPLPAGISPELTDFLMACFTRDERQRPSALRLRAHRWLEHGGEAKLTPPESVLGSDSTPPDSVLGSVAASAVGSVTASAHGDIPEYAVPKEGTIREIGMLQSSLHGSEHTPTDPSKEGTLNWQESPADGSGPGSSGRRRTASSSAAAGLDSSSERAASVAGIKPPTLPRPMTKQRSGGDLGRGASFGGGSRATRARSASGGAAQPGSPLVSPRGDPGAPSFDGRESDGLLTGTSLPSIGSAADLDLMVDGPPTGASPALRPADSPSPALGDSPVAAPSRPPTHDTLPGGGASGGAMRPRASSSGACGAMDVGMGGATSSACAAFRERPEDGNCDGLLPPSGAAPDFRALLSRLLRAADGPPGSARTAPSPSGGGGDYGLSGEGALAVGDSDDYIDPFSHIERANIGREGDEEHKKQRAHLRSLIHELQQAAETKNEQRTLQVSEQLTSYFEGIEKKAAEAAAAAAADADWEGGGGGGNGGRRNGQRLHGEITAFVSEHGMLPLVTSLRTMTGTKVTLQLLRLLNALLDGGGPSVCETACLLGVIPPALRFVENQYPPRTRLQAARFTHLMCTRAGAFTLQMFVACQGLPAVVILLADAANGRELVLLAVDAIKAVLDMRGRSPRNDLCRTLVDLDILQLLVDAMHEIAPHHKGHADKCAEIFLLFSCADPVVKARMATGRAGGRVLHGLMRVLSSPENFESALTLKVLRCVKHLCMGEAAHMDELQKARAVPHLVALLRVKQGGGRLEAEMRNQCVNALYLLCQISRSRQEEAALHGVLPLLQEIIRQRSPLKEFALPIVCDIAKASKVARVQLKKQAAVEFYLDLLATPYWQEKALDALLVWLQDEAAYVNRFMVAAHGVAQLQAVIDAPSAASFANMLEPLRTIVRTSTPVNKALGQIQPGQGCSPFVRSLVGRLEHRSAIVRRMLLEILTSIYEKHASPKQLVEKHRLKPVLANIKEHDPVVIPREIARNLYSSFQIHDIL